MRKLVACTLLGLAACGPAIDPNDPADMVPPLALEPPPIYSLLGYRTDLRLTSAQISTLDSVAQAVDDSTREPVGQLRRRATENSRYRGMIPVTDEVRPLLEQVRAQHLRAAETVREVLTAEQETTVCRLFTPDREERARARERRSDRRTRGDRRLMTGAGAGADSLHQLAPGSFWSWCAGISADSAGSYP